MSESHSPVFISYSNSERSPGDLAQDDTPEDHRSRKEYVRSLIGDLKRELHDVGHSVWVDQDRILPGWDFGVHIDRGIAECLAAVVLIDRDAVEASQYMRRELTLLLHHRARGLQVVPVLLGGVTLQQLGASSLMSEYTGLPGVSILDASGGIDDSEGRSDVAKRIVRALEPSLAKLTQGPAKYWMDAVCSLLLQDGVEPMYAGLREDLGIDERESVYRHLPERVIAAALLNAERTEVEKAITRLQAVLSAESLKRLVDHVRPLWVEHDDATVVAEALEPDSQRRVVALPTDRVELGRDVVKRSTFCSTGYQIDAVAGVVGEGSVDEMLHAYEKTLRMGLGFTGEDEESDPAPLEEVVDEVREIRQGALGLINTESLEARHVLALKEGLDRRFPGFTFIFMAGKRRENLPHGVEKMEWEPATMKKVNRYVNRMNGYIGKEVIDRDIERS